MTDYSGCGEKNDMAQASSLTQGMNDAFNTVLSACRAPLQAW